MCWAGCNRLGAIAAHLGMDERAAHWSSIATAMQARLLDQAWKEKRGAFAAAIGIDDLDASVLLLPEIGLLETRDPRSCTLWRRSNASFRAATTLCDMLARMTSASRKRLFSCAGSG
jgi:GH15 family glucan-1,4-alpha-glucosidase